jgi:uncharacterized membrane protein HdeD (DUF308 family)
VPVRIGQTLDGLSQDAASVSTLTDARRWRRPEDGHDLGRRRLSATISLTGKETNMKTLSRALVWRGILALAVGLIAVAWPGITIGAFVILFAVYAVIGAGTEAARAFRSDGVGPAAGRIALAAVDLAAGVLALAWPGITALALVWIVALWALATGVAEVVMAFGAGESAGERALYGLGGLVSIALGVVFAIRPDIGAETIAQVYGLFSIIAGVSALVMAANLGDRLRSRPLASL